MMFYVLNMPRTQIQWILSAFKVWLLQQQKSIRLILFRKYTSSCILNLTQLTQQIINLKINDFTRILIREYQKETIWMRILVTGN